MDFLFINEKEKKCVGVGFVPTESKTLFFLYNGAIKIPWETHATTKRKHCN